MNSPWIILGDFNCVANFDERHGQPVRLHEIKPFRECLDWCGMHDLHEGHFFTWSNKQAGQSQVMSKIDRVLGNDLWEEALLTTTVVFLLEGLFDHSPMVVSFMTIAGGKKPFRFFNFQVTRVDFLDKQQRDIRQARLSLYELQEQLHQDPNNEELDTLEQQASNTLRLPYASKRR